MTFDEAVARWAQSRHSIPEGFEIDELKIRHEDGWMSEAGTGYPPETTLFVYLKKVGGRTKLTRTYPILDTLEFMREVFEVSEESHARIKVAGVDG